MPLADLTNAADENRTPTKPAAAGEAVTPPPPPDDAVPPPPPSTVTEKVDVLPPTSEVVEKDDEVQHANSGTILDLLRFDHPHSVATFVVGNACFFFLPMFDVSPINVGAWCMLFGLCLGGGAAVFGRTEQRVPITFTEADLQSVVPHVLKLANAAAEVYHALFCCGKPQAALKAVGFVWALALASARISTMSLLWSGFVLAFAVPTAQLKFRSQVEVACARVQEECFKYGAIMLEKGPKTPIERSPIVLIGLVLAWLCISWTTVTIAMGVGCIGFQAWRDANPNNADAGMAYVHTIKSRARRMSISAGEVLRHGASAVGKSRKSL